MNIQQINEKFYVDLDEFCIMQIVENNETIENNKIIKSHSVIGITKNGLQVVLFKDDESGQINRCANWIRENWVKKRKLF